MLAGLCLVDGGHEYVLRAFDNFKEVMSEKIRFSKMMGWFKQHQDDVDFLHSCLQFINLVIHSGEDYTQDILYIHVIKYTVDQMGYN